MATDLAFKHGLETTDALLKTKVDPNFPHDEKQSADALSSLAAVALVKEGLRRFRIRAQVVPSLQRAFFVMASVLPAVLVAFCYVVYSVSPLVWRRGWDVLVIHDMLSTALSTALVMAILAILLCATSLLTACYIGPRWARFYYRHVATRASVLHHVRKLILEDDPCPTFAAPMEAYEFYEAFGRVLHPAALDSAGWVHNMCEAAHAQTTQEKAKALAEALVMGCGC